MFVGLFVGKGHVWSSAMLTKFPLSVKVGISGNVSDSLANACLVKIQCKCKTSEKYNTLYSFLQHCHYAVPGGEIWHPGSLVPSRSAEESTGERVPVLAAFSHETPWVQDFLAKGEQSSV